MMENKYTIIDKKYLADALSFLGLRYFIFNKEDGRKVYSFEDNEKFHYTLAKILDLKKEINSL